MLNSPLVFFFFSLFVLWLAEQIGALMRRREALKDDEREDFGILQTACLTLLGLIIGFSFSMAISRYDLRKNYEEAEANAIGTEYVRTGLLPAADAAAVRAQLKKYLELRILFYKARNEGELRQINADTAQLQEEMWSAVQVPALAQPTPVIALAVSGMNDVLNSQGYTQAAWWNRIPMSTWSLWWPSPCAAICWSAMVGVALKQARTCFLFCQWLSLSRSFSSRTSIARVAASFT